MSIAASPALFYDLLDDAAMFPPARRTPADALARHLEIRSGPDSEFVGPLVVSIDAWTDFTSAVHAAEASVDVVVVGTTTPPPAPDGVVVLGVEGKATGGPMPRAAGRIALEPTDLSVVEDLLAEIGEARIDGHPMLAKFRTGGMDASAFPSEEALAFCILASFNAGVPFKLTAGLHHAVRHTAADTGFEHHGFVNVMVAVAHCLQGASQDDIAHVLAERDATPLVKEIGEWSADDAVSVRSVFVSFGCCAVDEPLADVRELGLLAGRAA